MLQRWGTINADESSPNPQSSAPVPDSAAHRETSEHRELRLRKQYEQALVAHQNSETESAKRQFEQIATDLRESRVARRGSGTQPSQPAKAPLKRPRSDESPLWERRLRYAVHRNLGEAYSQLGEYKSSLAAYAAALDDDRSDFLIWVHAARAATLCGRLHVARRAFETALSMRPAHWLCQPSYHAVLQAVGDADEDCDCGARVDNEFEKAVVDMVANRAKFQQIEAEEGKREDMDAPEVIRLRELTWNHLVESLRSCLQNRLTGKPRNGTRPVAHPVKLEYAPAEALTDQPVTGTADDDSSDEVQLISDSSPPKPSDDVNDMDVILVPTTKDGDPNHSNGSRENGAPGPEVERNPDAARNGDVVLTSALGTASNRNVAVIENLEPINGISDLQHAQRASVACHPAMGFVSVPEKDAENPNSRSALPLGTQVNGDGGKQPEIRRSNRQRPQTELAMQEGERRQTRTAAGVKDSTQEDAELVQSMLKVCLCEENEVADGAGDAAMKNSVTDERQLAIPTEKARDEVRGSCSWVKYVDERQEAESVERCLKSLEGVNSGPTDLLLRVLESLSELRVVQYSSTLALLWSTLREKLQLHMPGTALTTVLIVEAMLESGKKAGKAKARRFQEASRLLSHIRLTSPNEDEEGFLRIRISWLWSLLHEYRREMQLSFTSAEQTLSLLQHMNEWSEGSSPEELGPALSGYTCDELKKLLSHRISSLKMARDLEKAKEELAKVGIGDGDAATRTVSILASSVLASIRYLELDTWRDDDLRIEFSDAAELEKWEKKLDAETELEPRLTVFGEACVESSDAVGELVVFSVRLRMAVHYYAAKLRTEIEGREGSMPSDTDSSTGRLADLLVQIRKYVALIKKLSASGSSALWNCDVGISGWSMKKALSIASITLVSLSALIVTKIPLLRFSTTNTDLGASQKNRRLGFMRCMLAFARCILLVHKCRQSAQTQTEDKTNLNVKEESLNTRKMLSVISFCLRALVARGCCREEGTSGALIKLYVKFLCTRLREMASRKQRDLDDAEKSHEMEEAEQDISREGKTAPGINTISPLTTPQIPDGTGLSSDGSLLTSADVNYEWGDVRVVRHELSQCYQCLYQIQELESISGDGNVLKAVRWLEDGCRVSKHIGLSFTTGDPTGSVANMDIDMCKGVYFFYRKRIFEGVCLRRRDGGRAKRLREVLSRLAEALPEDAPSGVRMLPFHALDKIVSDVVETREDISREAAENVSRLEEEWNRCDTGNFDGKHAAEERVRNVQLSILFFEVFALHAMSTLSAHESEYKKHKTAERRKRPKEAAERLLSASSECIIALRSRPWSVGAWILLGRIFVEISDLALDERELNLSSFGLYRAEDLATLADGEAVETVFGRAEACFGFAASLLKHSWAKNASNQTKDLDASLVLSYSYDGSEDGSWCGFGDDGDLFGSFGLTNKTTSRPSFQSESHPDDGDDLKDSRRIAAIRFGEAAMSMLRLRELRYFHSHWNQSVMESRLPTHPRNRFPDSIIDLGTLALKQLREGRSLLGLSSQQVETCAGEIAENSHRPNDSEQVSAYAHTEIHWRTGYVGIERLKWYFSLLEGKLVRKGGGPPEEYLSIFQRCVSENRELRESLRQPPDVEPVYKLHVSRMKVLRTIEDNTSAARLLTLLEQYAFRKGPIVVDVGREGEKEAEDWITERKIAIAEDILSAMQSCSDPKSDVTYAEYYYKSTFCRGLILAEVLKDTRGALEELSKLFRAEAAAKVLDQGPDGIHRGYFYKMWNYRITDTGTEPALESERKLVRWRSKILGLYGQLLRQTGEWRLLAAIIYRLRKRASEDLPVDGALLDDLITAYAVTNRAAILNSMEKGILSNAAVFESSYRRTWDIYVETLRLAQGVKRVRVSIARGENSETGAERLLRSERPRCLVAIHTALRLEHLRWKSVNDGLGFNLEAVKALPVDGTIKSTPEAVRLGFVETVQVSASKWPLDEKLMKLLVRRISEYAASENE